MLSEITSEELSAALDAVADHVLDETRIDRPPVDAMAVAHRLGITVAIDARQRGRARSVRLGVPRRRVSRATVLLRPEPRGERLQWALSHEIGEHVACRVFAALGIDPRETPPEGRERVANHLAGRLLLPRRWFAADGAACEWDLLWLKARYATASHELIARRMIELPTPVIVTIFDQGAVYLRSSNVAGQVPPLLLAERRCWQTVHDTGRPYRVGRRAQRVQGWPVHEDTWKREILRTEVEPEMM